MAKTRKKTVLDRNKKKVLIGAGLAAVGLGVALWIRSRSNGTPPPPPPTGSATVSGSVKDSSGTPVDGAPVVIGTVTAKSDAQGNFAFPDPFATGSATVEVNMAGYQLYSAQVTLHSGQNTIDIVLSSGPPSYQALVSGAVTDKNSSAAISGALVTLSIVNTNQSVGQTTDSAGAFSFSNIQSGISVHWACSAKGYTTAEGDVTLQDGNNPLDIELTAVSPYYGSPFSYSNVSVTPYNNYATTGVWDVPDFKATITNSSSQPANHQIKMMFQRLYNGAIDLPPTQAYSNPSSITLQPGASYDFEDNFWNPLRGAYDYMMYPQQGVVDQFWLEDENGNKSAVVSTGG